MKPLKECRESLLGELLRRPASTDFSAGPLRPVLASMLAGRALGEDNMKWKKFIHRHYCQRGGIYVCPAPSCGECADYAKCFSPEK